MKLKYRIRKIKKFFSIERSRRYYQIRSERIKKLFTKALKAMYGDEYDLNVEEKTPGDVVLKVTKKEPKETSKETPKEKDS